MQALHSLDMVRWHFAISACTPLLLPPRWSGLCLRCLVQASHKLERSTALGTCSHLLLKGKGLHQHPESPGLGLTGKWSLCLP